MKVVLDTNVLVSGLITPAGTCSWVLDLFWEDVFELGVDRRILDEYQAVLLRPELSLPAEELMDLLLFVAGAAEDVIPGPLPAKLPDSSDLPFLEVAALLEAVLVTGNKRHYPAEERRGVRVLSPREFLDRLAEE